MAEKISTVTFYAALLIELTLVILDKSDYITRYEGLWFRLTFVLTGISMITAKHRMRDWIALFVFAAMGVISYMVTDRNEILRFVVFVFACQGKNIKEVLKVTFWYTLAGCLLLMVLSLAGIHGTVALTQTYREVEETRYCFGMGHPNAFHCMVFALTLLGVYCYHERLRWKGYLLLFLLHTGVFYFTDSRAGLLVSLGALLLFVLLTYVPFLQTWKWSYLAGIAFITGAVLLSVAMAAYSTNLPLFAKLDVFLTGRIFALLDSTYDEGMLNTWFLWGAARNTKYFDLGIVRVFYWFGILPGITYYLAQCRLLWCGFKKHDYMLLAVVVAITAYSIFEAHFVSVYIGRNYIFLFLGMYLTELLGGKEL